MPDDPLQFYSVNDDFGEFSNFASYAIQVDGKRWPTSEHYFQAMKFTDPAQREKIRACKQSAQAARLGRERSVKIRRDWESARISVMMTALVAKFTQHPVLRELLLSTGDRPLVEHTENDDFWGDGGNGKGRNMLGRQLMQVRERLRAEAGTESGGKQR